MIKLIQKISQGTEADMVSKERNSGIDQLRFKKNYLMDCKAIQLYPLGPLFLSGRNHLQFINLLFHLTSQSLISNLH